MQGGYATAVSRGSCGISVVVPTLNRATQLTALLADLEGQTFPSERLEVIVVDDGSVDDTAHVLSAARSYSLRSWRESRVGAAAARNVAARVASGEVLVFLDDDMRLERDYLIGLYGLHATRSQVIGMGCCSTVSPGPETSYSRYAARQHSRCDGVGEVRRVHYTRCVTNNLSVAHEDFERIGGFRNVVGDGPATWGDVEFGYRAAKTGFRFYECSHAKCTHVDYGIVDVATACRRAYKVGFLAPKLQAACPGVEDDLPMLRDKLGMRPLEELPNVSLRKALRHVSATGPAVACLKSVVQVAERWRADWVLSRLYRWLTGAYLYMGYRDGSREEEGHTQRRRRLSVLH